MTMATTTTTTTNTTATTTATTPTVQIDAINALLDRKASVAAILEKAGAPQLTTPTSEAGGKGNNAQLEDMIFELFKVPHRNEASVGRLLSVLQSYGIREDDPRVEPMMARVREIEELEELQSHERKDPKSWRLPRHEFKRCISTCLPLLTDALRNNFVLPNWDLFTDRLRLIFQKCRTATDGRVATYIPQLARQDPNHWGVAICTVDGQRASWGDSRVPFCFQSVSKAFNYAIAASERGADLVHAHVGQEPSGRLFNEICLDKSGRPHNPMVNSGAIIVTSLIKNSWTMADRFDFILNEYKKIAGGGYVGFNNATFLSERATADRNYALAYYMKEHGCFPAETRSLTDALDFYFQLCSLETHCESLSVMAATLANGGVCPITGQRCLEAKPTRDCLSLMYSCGMYDASGQFAFHVGLPAKSGVSGVIMLVVPNIMGVALFSPPLDRLGNSVRGTTFCKELIQHFNFHNYDSLASAAPERESNAKWDPRRRVGDMERARVVSLLNATKNGDLNAMQRLHKSGISMELADYDLRTPLHLAASEGMLDVCRFLVDECRVAIDARDRYGRTALDDAKAFGKGKCARLLERATKARRGSYVTSDLSSDGSDSDSSHGKNDEDEATESLSSGIATLTTTTMTHGEEET